MLHLGARRPDRRGGRRPLRQPGRNDQPQRAALRLARRGPAPGRASTGASCSARPWRRSPRPARRSRRSPGLAVLDETHGRPAGIAGWDPLRLSIDVRGTGSTGYRLAKAAFYSQRASTSSSTPRTSSSRSSASASRRRRPASAWSRRCARRVAELEAEPGAPEEKLAPPPPWGELAMTPREAFLGPQEVVPFDRRRRPRRRRGAGRLPARHPQRPPRRAPDRGDPRLHQRERRPRRLRARRQRPRAEDAARRPLSTEAVTPWSACHCAPAPATASRLGAMASFDAIADLPLEIEACEFEGLGVTARRVRTADDDRQAARRRRGGDRRGRRLRRRRPHRPAGPRTARGPRRLRHLRRVLRAPRRDRPLPGRAAGARGVSRDYRRWAFESAALDLALRQAGTNLAAALGREPRPVNFVNSMRLAGRRRRTLLDRAAAAPASPSTRPCASSSTPPTTGTTS